MGKGWAGSQGESDRRGRGENKAEWFESHFEESLDG